MFKRFILVLFVWISLTGASWGSTANLGDQAKKEIADGFFLDSEIGLLTFLVLDGARIYRPGMMLSFRFGGYLSSNFTLYGRLGATVTGNTNCYGDPNACGDKNFRKDFPTASILRQVPRQGLSIIAGIGSRFYFLKLEDRLRLFINLELLAQIIPPDSIPEERLSKLEGTGQRSQIKVHENPAIGGGGGLGLGFEYFFILKHFSVGANATFYFFATPFMPNGSLLGGSLLVSVDMKYTF